MAQFILLTFWSYEEKLHFTFHKFFFPFYQGELNVAPLFSPNPLASCSFQINN